MKIISKGTSNHLTFVTPAKTGVRAYQYVLNSSRGYSDENRDRNDMFREILNISGCFNIKMKIGPPKGSLPGVGMTRFFLTPPNPSK
jgi:hypothetical protein